MHTGGEPLRIILDGYPTFDGLGILEIRRELELHHDHLRKILMWEPRGHADMYGLLKVPAQRKDSAFGVIFMHNAGYSTMCGHATIAIGKAAIHLGWVNPTPPLTTFKIDAPCGQLEVFVHHNQTGGVKRVSFENVPSFYVGRYEVEIPAVGKMPYDLAYGGAFYAYLDINQLGISCEPKHYSEIIRWGKTIKKAVIAQNSDIRHPFEEDLSFLYGCIFIDKSKREGIHSKNVCVFADGEVDRSPTGSGVSGRAAIHYNMGQLGIKEEISIESILGTEMEVSIDRTENYDTYEAIIPWVSGTAYFTGTNEFWIDSEDPLSGGFFLQ
ncbi:MAG: proline racemase family protein [Bacteroidia bacterium]|nr:proline racemase family protein [Bacteroidia bacterium]